MPANTCETSLLRHLPYLLLVLLAGLISRLPQLLSPNLLLDDDEAVVGLMAKHILVGKPVTLYFYGQKYGFAYPEALAGALSFKLFGYGALQLKLAMLAIWLGALAFFYLTAAKLTSPTRGVWLALLFALFPAWAVWSMKARGGYLTSFFISSGLVYLFLNRRKDFTAAGWLGIGVLLGIVYYAQAFWLAGLFPLIAYHFYKYARKSRLLWLISGIALVAAFFMAFGSATSTFWQPVVIGQNENIFEPLQNLPGRFFQHLTGYYYLFIPYKPDPVTNLLISVWIGISLLFTILPLFRGAQWLAGKRSKEPGNVAANLLFLSVLATLSYNLFLNEANFGYRYLLPVSGFIALWLGAEINLLCSSNSIPKTVFRVLVPVFIAAGAVSLYNFRKYSVLEYTGLESEKNNTEEAHLRDLFTFLKANNVHHLYSRDQLLEWFVPFYSQETIICRAKPPIDRYPEYPQQVDEAFKQGKPTAIIGYFPPEEGVITNLSRPDAVQRVGYRYFVYLHPSFEELVKIGFYKGKD